MSKSEDNTNELESYGVWVKNTAGNEPSQTTDQADAIDTDVDDMGLDLPDFDDTDFSDMFKDDSQFTSTEQEDTFGGDSTLSTDELANITDIAEDTSVDLAEEPEPIFDEVEELSESDVSDLGLDNITEEEISLDDFMDEGFSDESVASGNNGYEPGAEQTKENNNTSETEELSLDDFLDGDSFDEIVEEKTEATTEETPLDMDISFDDSIEAVETEENLSIDNDDFDDSEDVETAEQPSETLETEEVSFDDFGITAETPAENEIEDTIAEASSNDTVNFDTEEIDLSDFGIDSEAEETPIVQDVETQKNKEQVVDYDLFIGNETTSTAPVVNEIKSEEPVEEVTEPEQTEPSNTTSVDNSLLQQIVADLSSLKNEINTLKTNIAEIKANENVQQEALTIPEDTEDQGGFFNPDDTDDTIALSGDELSNIMNNADFGDSADEYAIPSDNTEDETNDELDVEPEVIEEPEEFDFAETTIDETEVTSEKDVNSDDDLSFDYEDEKLEEPNIEEISDKIDIDSEEENEDIPEEISIPKEEGDIFVESTSSDFMDSVKDSTEEDIISTDSLEEMEEVNGLETEESFEDIVDGLNIDDEIEDITDFEDAELPEDESESTTESETSDEIKLPSVEDIENDISTPVEDVAEEENEEVPTVDMLLNTPVDENVTSDFSPSITDEETESLTAVDNEEIDDDFNSVDNLDNDLSTSNIDYLTSEEEDSEVTSEVKNNNNNDLKQEIKSVLLYMDQLLENLPEDKIYEFAKSDEFATYKKLFKDLGLS